MNEVVMISVDKIAPNPQNPRQDVGDLTEMVESIKKNGIMQNLVVTKTGDADDYILLIGHRRFEASKQAGLTEVPCVILDEKTAQEQMAIMLEENMQRADLTPTEQAFGFQMMLDLGETEETIAEKTGFSKTTVKRRLEIAKLDKDKLSEREKDGNFQLSLTDLYELEKIESVEKRNEILAIATDSRDLVARAHRQVREDEKAKNKAKLIELMEAFDIKPAPKGTENELYGNKWNTIKQFRYDEEVDELEFDQDYEAGMTWLYVDRYYEMVVVEKAKKEKKEKTEQEIKADQDKADKKKLKDIYNSIADDMTDFVIDIAKGGIKDIPKAKHQLLTERLWKLIQENVSYGISKIYGIAFLLKAKETYNIPEEQKTEYMEKYDSLPIHIQMLCIITRGLKNIDITTYKGELNESTKRLLDEMIEILDAYGFSIEDDEKLKVISGEHELFKVEETTEENSDDDLAEEE